MPRTLKLAVLACVAFPVIILGVALVLSRFFDPGAVDALVLLAGLAFVFLLAPVFGLLYGGYLAVRWFRASRPEALQADSETVETPPTAEPTTTEAPPVAALMPSLKVGKRWRLYLGVSVGVTLLALIALPMAILALHWNDTGHRNANGTWTDPWRETCAMNRTFTYRDARWCDTGHRNADGTWTDYVGDTCAMNRTYMFREKARVCS